MTDAHAAHARGDQPTNEALLEMVWQVRRQSTAALDVTELALNDDDMELAATAASDLGACGMALRDLLMSVASTRDIAPGPLAVTLRRYLEAARRRDDTLFPPEVVDELLEEARMHDLHHEAAEAAQRAANDAYEATVRPHPEPS